MKTMKKKTLKAKPAVSAAVRPFEYGGLCDLGIALCIYCAAIAAE